MAIATREPIRVQRNTLPIKRIGGGVMLAALGSIALAAVVWKLTDSPRRMANPGVRLPLSPASETAWTTENAFPALKFFEPTCIAFAADGSGRVLILERRGTVQLFQNEPATTRSQTVLDISDRVWRTAYEDDGAVAIALHPEFGQKGSANRDFFYLLYTARLGKRRSDRLSRFTLQGDHAGDELVLIEQQDDDLWHNGGGLVFGADGFLYVGVGDEGTNGDGLSNGQRIDRDLFCGVLRIDVDQQGGTVSHPPRRQPESGKTTGYYIPSDNPFVGEPGVLEEFWAHGLRNPYRLAFDSVTGRLWAADVGHLRREEINLIVPGGNYGWSYREGTLPFSESYLRGQPPATHHGSEQPPVWEYPHLNGDNCVIGGYVYRGQQHPQLDGKYLYADNGSGRVWALTYDGQRVTSNEELLSLPVSSKTGIASLQPDADGQPLLLILGEHDTTGGTIRRIIPAERGAAATYPPRLSETGLFADVATLTPAEGVIPYDVNAGQSVGEVAIRRWLLLPGDGSDPDAQTDRIGYRSDAPWEFPVGAVFVQHFELAADMPHAAWPRRLETRLLVRHSGGGVYGISYRWNETGDDAELVNEAAELTLTVPDAEGNAQPFQWHYLSRQSCLACHNKNAGFVLGVNTRQLNRNVEPRNFWESPQQLLAWSHNGMFAKSPDPSEWTTAARLVAPADETADLDQRARSFLDVNCAACHRSGGARANFMAGYEHTADVTQLAKPAKQTNFGMESAHIVAAGDPYRSVLYYRMAKLGQGRMPFVASHRLDKEGLSLIRRWIEQLGEVASQPVPPEVAEKRAWQTDQLQQLVRRQPDASSAVQVAEALLSDTSGAFALWEPLLAGEIEEPLRSEIIAAALQSRNDAVRDLYEWFVAPDQRTQRLGTQFDPSSVLLLTGDSERGKQLYHNNKALTCRGCHQVRSDTAVALGPSLWNIHKKHDPEQLLHHIVDPSARIEKGFETWTVATVNGQVLVGLIVSRTDEEIVLKDANGRESHLSLDDIDLMEPQKKSLMPDNLLQGLTPTEAADLLAYLRSLQ